jgi:hypothetical protein
MDALTLALLEMKREGRTPADKNYGSIWVRRVYQINNYIMKSQGHIKRGHKSRI